MAGWLVGRAGAEDLRGSRMQEMVAWLRALDVDPDYIALRVAVTQESGGYRLHLSEFLRNEQGKKFLDVAANEPATRPVVVAVEKDSWPAWLTGLSTPLVEAA